MPRWYECLLVQLDCVVPEHIHTPQRREIILRPLPPGFSVSVGIIQTPTPLDFPWIWHLDPQPPEIPVGKRSQRIQRDQLELPTIRKLEDSEISFC